MISKHSVVLLLFLVMCFSSIVSGDERDFTLNSVSGTLNPDANELMVDFSGAPTSGRAPLMVMFSDLTKGDPSEWYWDFGDGETSPMEDPVHTYSQNGLYTVRLTAFNQGISGTKIKEQYIEAGPLPVKAKFSATPTSGVAPLTVQFQDQSQGAMIWLWNFGDGSESMIPDPSHTFEQPGAYHVRFTVSTDQGYSDYTEQVITVRTGEEMNAEFTGTPTSGSAPLQVLFTDLSSGEIISRAWDFGDGIKATVQNPVHTFVRSGLYSVSLTVRNADGGMDTELKQNYINVKDDPPLSGSIPIYSGWNFVSVPKNLAPGKDTAQIFEHLDVDGHSALVYEPSRGWVPLTRTSLVRPLTAIWVYSKKNDNVPISYDPQLTQIVSRPLSNGWNAVGFTGLSPTKAKNALSSVKDTWQNSIGFDARIQMYSAMIFKGINDEAIVQPYGGYWVYLSGPGVLTGF